MTKDAKSKHDRRQALLKEQEAARKADPRPSEEIIREARSDWPTYGEEPSR